jgi:hypothetical protein
MRSSCGCCWLRLTGHKPEVVDAVQNLRRRSRAEVHTYIATAFSGYGPEAARSTADALADFGLTAIEGAFLRVTSAELDLHRQLLDQLADAISVLGEAHLAQRESRGSAADSRRGHPADQIARSR